MMYSIYRIAGARPLWWTPTGSWDSSQYAAARLSHSFAQTMHTMLVEHYGENVHIVKSPIR